MFVTLGLLQVLSVEYPLAPEHQFPAAVVDTAAAYSWLCQQLQQQGSSAVIMPGAPYDQTLGMYKTLPPGPSWPCQ
jgi:hypothetical protein